jgi:hypothetical protein
MDSWKEWKSMGNGKVLLLVLGILGALLLGAWALGYRQGQQYAAGELYRLCAPPAARESRELMSQQCHSERQADGQACFVCTTPGRGDVSSTCTAVK